MLPPFFVFFLSLCPHTATSLEIKIRTCSHSFVTGKNKKKDIAINKKMDCIELSPVIHDTNIQKILPISENCDNESVKNIEKKEEIVEEISTIPSSVSDDPLKQEEKENSMSVTDDPLKQEEKFDLGDIDMDSDGLFELENDIIKAKNNIDFNNFLTSEDVSKVVELIEQVEKETCEFENFEESENSMSSTESNGKLIIDEDQDFDDETTLAERVASAILSPSSIKITHDFSNQPSTSQQDVYDPQNQGTFFFFLSQYNFHQTC